MMSDNKDSDIPDAKVCEELCNQFAAVTNTDVIFAQFMLQRRKWNLDVAIDAYFNRNYLTSDSSSSDDENEAAPIAKVLPLTLTTVEGSKVSKLKFVSWNIDGLDNRSLKARTENVAAILNCEKPDVVHLQELVPESYSIIETLLPEYKVISGKLPGVEYFTATLLRRDTITYESDETTSFINSVMGRNLLVVKVRINDSSFIFLNAHLESTRDFEDQRKKQLITVFEKVKSTDVDYTVFFAGDLNLRDKELQEIGGIPAGIEDLWITCGSRRECIYTWDPVRNTNLEMSYPHRARFRFDRVYVRRGNQSCLVPKHFGLIGLEKIESCGRFPSDHWGVICHFEI